MNPSPGAVCTWLREIAKRNGWTEFDTTLLGAVPLQPTQPNLPPRIPAPVRSVVEHHGMRVIGADHRRGTYKLAITE